MRAPWLEPHDEFEGVGAHELNARYAPVDELDAGFTIAEAQQQPALPALVAARSFLIQSLATITPRLDGPDIAHYQWDAGPLNLATTRQACDWFAQKCSQSVKYLDPTFGRARTQAFALDFRAQGYYHWLSSTTDPEQQAAWFLKNLGELRPGEFAMLDDEEGGVTVAQTLAWLEAVEQVTKRPCAVYTGAYVGGGTIWQNTGVREGEYGPRPMILAAYTSEVKARALPGVKAYPWSSWQWSSNGPVPGITGRCDMNRVDDWAVYDAASGRTADQKPNHIDVITPDAPTPSPVQQETDMPCIILGRGQVALLDAGYTTGLSAATLNKSTLPALSLADDEWDNVVANSDRKKAADAAAAKGGTVTPNGMTVPTDWTGTITLAATK